MVGGKGRRAGWHALVRWQSETKKCVLVEEAEGLGGRTCQGQCERSDRRSAGLLSCQGGSNEEFSLPDKPKHDHHLYLWL